MDKQVGSENSVAVKVEDFLGGYLLVMNWVGSLSGFIQFDIVLGANG